MTTATANETYSVPRINDIAPDFTAETTQGTIHFHDWIGDSWAVLFSHPKDFTPVCTTELGYMAKLQPDFAKRNVKILGLSIDPVSSHQKWEKDIEETQGAKVTYPMIGDPQLKIAKLYGMLPGDAGETCEGRTPADNATVRTVFVIGPDKKIKLQPEFAKRNVKILGLSIDPVSSHQKWEKDIEETQGAKVTYPMIGDPQLKVAKLYGMLPGDAGETCEGRTPADNATVRTVFVIGPDKKIKLQLAYPMSTGRNFDEILRVIDSIQLTTKHKVSTPVNWKPGDDVIISGAVSNEEAQQKFPGFKTVKPYLRTTAQPK